jgi:hypothetical protein
MLRGKRAELVGEKVIAKSIRSADADGARDGLRRSIEVGTYLKEFRLRPLSCGDEGLPSSVRAEGSLGNLRTRSYRGVGAAYRSTSLISGTFPSRRTTTHGVNSAEAKSLNLQVLLTESPALEASIQDSSSSDAVPMS